MNILQINASIRGAASHSSRLASEVVARLQGAGDTVQLRDLGANPPATIDPAALQALFTPAEQRTPEQAARVAQDDALIAELQAADTLVIGMPMYNFTVPVQFKSWLDAICRAQVTFRYTANGPEGLLTGKRAVIVLARGGNYTPDSDTQVPYLRQVLGFVGITDITFIHAEGLNLGPDAEAAALASARSAIAALA
jgi:FMN-dependent NADH-azoreductase